MSNSYRDRAEMEIMERLQGEVDKLREYITLYGFCGYEGTMWATNERDCEKCGDHAYCERYEILGGAR